MNRFALTLAAVAALIAPSLASAAPCRDVNGRFVKCPGGVVAPPAVPRASPSAHAMAAHSAAPAHAMAPHPAAPASPMAPRQCRNAQGHFAKCP